MDFGAGFGSGALGSEYGLNCGPFCIDGAHGCFGGGLAHAGGDFIFVKQ